MDYCSKIIEKLYASAEGRGKGRSFIAEPAVRERVEKVALCLKNRAGVRALLACTLAKAANPKLDIRKPYTDIAGETTGDAYSGRLYDERHIQRLLEKPYYLPINSTTAFLTPGFRTKNIALTPDTELEGRPAEMYKALLMLFEDIQTRRVAAKTVLAETLRLLVIERDHRQESIQGLVRDIRRSADKLPLSAEEIVSLIAQHLACKSASRVPVLIVAAAYRAATNKLGERVLPLHQHNAADKQTGSAGDIEITLINDESIITAYEIKMRSVAIADIDMALAKIKPYAATMRNYVFVTTEPIAAEVRQYAAAKYEDLGGVEIAILDGLGFLRHFLHLFHRLRTDFLNAYQDLLLAEPESAVSHALKEAFLTLRKAAEGAQ